MAFWHGFTIPANTAEDTPQEETVLLIAGSLVEIEILYPPGPAGLVHVQIWDQEHQLYPREPGQSFVGDDTYIKLRENRPIVVEPFGFILRGWSPSTRYSHIVYVHFEVMPFGSMPQVIMSAAPLPGGLS